MIQRREDFRFALKPCQPISIGRERCGQDLDRDLAFEPGIGRAIDVPLTLPGSTRWDPTFAIARDGRTIYYGARRQEADIWLAERLNRN